MTVRFEQVVAKRRVKVGCKICNVSRMRTLSVMNTVNPFNKDERGFTKTRIQVHADVTRKLAEDVGALLKNGIVCLSCENK